MTKASNFLLRIQLQKQKALKWFPISEQSLQFTDNLTEIRRNALLGHPSIFFRPDYTVGSGVPPDHALRLAGCTADRELHPALKIFLYEIKVSVTTSICSVK